MTRPDEFRLVIDKRRNSERDGEEERYSAMKEKYLYN